MLSERITWGSLPAPNSLKRTRAIGPRRATAARWESEPATLESLSADAGAARLPSADPRFADALPHHFAELLIPIPEDTLAVYAQCTSRRP